MIVALVVASVLVGLVIGVSISHIRRQPHSFKETTQARRILLPFTVTTLSRRALEAAIRLARAEDATLMPAFLATVPRMLPLESPLPRQSLIGMPLLEAIEQRAIAHGVPVDSRVQSGRSYRHALDRLLEGEQFDRVIVSTTEDLRTGLSGSDLLWLLTHTSAEVMILKPAPRDTHIVSTDNLKGHF